MVKVIRQFSNVLEVIVPSYCRSAGTLVCLGADSIVMTKQATLGPIDPSVNTPLNPCVSIPNSPMPAKTVPVSVEALRGFLDFAKTEFGIKDGSDMTQVIKVLTEKVHPLVLGESYRTLSQIRMLGKRLLKNQVTDDNKVEKILRFLCSESGSHDYAIYRDEARDELELNVENPSEPEYKLISNIMEDITNELQLHEPYSVLPSGTSYEFTRGLIESVDYGSHRFLSIGSFQDKTMQTPIGPQIITADIREFDGWRFNHV